MIGMRSNFETKIGVMWVEVENGKIVGIGFGAIEEKGGDGRNDRIVIQAKTEINEYLEGVRQGFSLPLELRGSKFQKNVWQVMAKIPYGITMSYGEIAKLINCKGGARAVGRACGCNPVVIVGPCHRVVRSNGMMGGYSGELWRKEYLLALERNY